MKFVLLMLTVFEGCFYLVSPNPVTTPTASDVDAADFLTKYGYLVSPDPRSGKLRTKEDYVAGIKQLQRYAGLKETGQLDADTLALIKTDRCGVADFSQSDNTRRRKRYTLQGSKWKKKDLTYKIIGYSDKLPRNQQRATFQKAFRMWQKASQLNFRETTGSADILINFQKRYHSDGYPFDGRGGTLAHAFYPHTNTGISGDAHFDSEEPWTLGSRRGVDLEWVAIHEFGHSLGLGHSRVRGSIMFPWYQGYKPNIQLTEDDKTGIQILYGKRNERTRPTYPPRTESQVTRPRPTRNPAVPDACVTSFDTFFSGESKRSYAFKGEYFWIIKSTAGIESGPHLINSRWRELRTPVDAALTDNYGQTFFFTGSQYFVYRGNRRVTGPANIRDIGLPEELSNMDAAFIWGGNGRPYFFKGKQYWRLSAGPIGRRSSIDPGYPRLIARAWRGVPNDITAAFKWHSGRTYFFKGNVYYRISDFPRVAVDRNYPQNTALVWMRCSKEEIRLAQEKKSAGHSILPSFVTVLVTLLLTRL